MSRAFDRIQLLRQNIATGAPKLMRVNDRNQIVEQLHRVKIVEVTLQDSEGNDVVLPVLAWDEEPGSLVASGGGGSNRLFYSTGSVDTLSNARSSVESIYSSSATTPIDGDYLRFPDAQWRVFTGSPAYGSWPSSDLKIFSFTVESVTYRAVSVAPSGGASASRVIAFNLTKPGDGSVPSASSIRSDIEGAYSAAGLSYVEGDIIVCKEFSYYLAKATSKANAGVSWPSPESYSLVGIDSSTYQAILMGHRGFWA